MIIGISGKIGSGKDTIATILKELQPQMNWEVKKYAGKIKQIATLLTGVPIEKWEDQEFKKQMMRYEWAKKTPLEQFNQEGHPLDGVATGVMIPMTYRTFLQKLGTEAMRDGLHVDVWLNALFADYERPSTWEVRYYDEVNKKGFAGYEQVWGTLPNWIITDVRFPNEAQAILARGGKLIRIERDVCQKIDHPSETSLDDWNDWLCVIKNNGTIEDLKTQVAGFVVPNW